MLAESASLPLRRCASRSVWITYLPAGQPVATAELAASNDTRGRSREQTHDASVMRAMLGPLAVSGARSR